MKTRPNDRADLERTLFRLETEPIGQDFEPLPGLKVRFIHAGHIVGAACIYLRYGNCSVYTGYNTASSRCHGRAEALTSQSGYADYQVYLQTTHAAGRLKRTRSPKLSKRVEMSSFLPLHWDVLKRYSSYPNKRYFDKLKCQFMWMGWYGR